MNLKVYLHIALSLTMADRVAAPENPWSAAMDEDGSPWDGKQPIIPETRASKQPRQHPTDSPRLDVPSRSQSNHNLAQAGDEAQTGKD